jgi:hypothetical protein
VGLIMFSDLHSLSAEDEASNLLEGIRSMQLELWQRGLLPALCREIKQEYNGL